MLVVFLFKGQKMMFPVFMATSFFLNIFLKEKKIKFSFILLWLIFIGHLFYESTKISTVIIYLIFLPLTFWLGSYLKNKSWIPKIGYLFFLGLVGVYGFSNLFFYIETYSSKVEITPPKMELLSDNGFEVRLDTIKGKVIVLDFWTTTCGYCFQKFPEYEKLYQKYKNNPSVELYAVNIPISRDTVGHAEKKIGLYNYSFPVLYADSDTIPKSLGFNRYPKLMIMKDSKIRYDGRLITDKDIFIDHTEDEIELLLNEDLK